MHFGYAFVSPYIRCPIISTFTLFVLGFSHFCTWTLLYGGPLFLFFSSIMLSSYDLTLYFIFLFLYSYLPIHLLSLSLISTNCPAFLMMASLNSCKFGLFARKINLQTLSDVHIFKQTLSNLGVF